MDKPGIILIGVGPHAKRVYLPLCRHYENQGRLKLSAIVELDSKKEETQSALRNHGYSPDSIDQYYLSDPKMQSKLLKLIEKEKIQNGRAQAVIISSEPLTHFDYAEWALQHGLHILMDKPITTYENVSTDLERAGSFLKDYQKLETEYKKAKKAKASLQFLVMAQRRFHNSYNLIKSAIQEIYELTSCPVSSINSFHSDGQWRTPHEMLTQLYHSYFQGYGKGSHSGYHYFDLIPYWLSACQDARKDYDEIETSSVFIRPSDFCAQLGIDDHVQALGPNFLDHHSEKETFYIENLKRAGEMDLSAQIELKSKGSILTHLNLYLAHNGVSHRHWTHPGERDLYKGIGRVAHESHIIEQGPFQAIHFHSYKSKENTLGESDYGGSKHLEVVIFRNNKLIEGEHVQKFQLDDFRQVEEKPTAISSPAKTKAFDDFLNGIEGKIALSRLDFSLQESSVKICQLIYESAILRDRNENPILRSDFKIQQLKALTPKTFESKVRARFIHKNQSDKKTPIHA